MLLPVTWDKMVPKRNDGLGGSNIEVEGRTPCAVLLAGLPQWHWMEHKARTKWIFFVGTCRASTYNIIRLMILGAKILFLFQI